MSHGSHRNWRRPTETSRDHFTGVAFSSSWLLRGSLTLGLPWVRDQRSADNTPRGCPIGGADRSQHAGRVEHPTHAGVLYSEMRELRPSVVLVTGEANSYIEDAKDIPVPKFLPTNANFFHHVGETAVLECAVENLNRKKCPIELSKRVTCINPACSTHYPKPGLIWAARWANMVDSMGTKGACPSFFRTLLAASAEANPAFV
ncbi:hypothetical protein BaRGS_00011876 [Batillaria attramentaria]|uniref:Ig-like domain-containing protein n=1 Tax=Batillaria attramentaria TaxID=370345 RepID=A0ABD0LC45_9CAEN